MLNLQKISSDYDFHFVVDKTIKLANHYNKQFDVSRIGAKKPKYETRLISTKNVTVFAMKPSNKENYDDQIAPVFEGENQDELNKNIQDYLDHLMLVINEPLEECPHCKGMGVKQQNTL